MSSQVSPNPSDSNARHEALLDISDVVCTHRDPQSLLHQLADRLRKVVDFDYVMIVLYDPEVDMMRLHLLEILIPGERPQTPGTMPVGETPAGWAYQNQQHVIFDPVDQETRFPLAVQLLRSVQVQSCCFL